MTGMERLNTCARMMVRGILGPKRWCMIPAIEDALLDDWDDTPISAIAKKHGIPRKTLERVIEKVRHDMVVICEAEKVTPEMVLARPDCDE